MGAVFLQVLNRSIAAGWLILAVVALRLLLRRAPRTLLCLLWVLVGLRLAVPFSPQSVLSLIPNGQAIPTISLPADATVISSGTAAAYATVSPTPQTVLPSSAAPCNPLCCASCR